MLFVGVDWGEVYHDVCLLDRDGSVLATRRIVDGLVGVGELHTLMAAHAEDPAQVAVGIETDRGLLVGALRAAGYHVYAVNPHAVSRYRGRHGSSRRKSDRADAKVLADLVRTDRHNHREVAGNSPLVEAVKVLARGAPEPDLDPPAARQRAAQRVAGVLPRGAGRARRPARPAGGAGRAAAGADPEQGRQLTRAAVRRTLIQAGRRRNLQVRVVAVHDGLAAPQLAAPALVQAAYGDVVGALVAVLGCLNQQIAELEQQLAARFAAHPDGIIVRSLPGLGVVLGARVLAEFGDDLDRYQTAKGRQGVRRHRPSHQILGTAHHGGRPRSLQPAAGGRLLPVGIRLADRLAGRTALL